MWETWDQPFGEVFIVEHLSQRGGLSSCPWQEDKAEEVKRLNCPLIVLCDIMFSSSAVAITVFMRMFNKLLTPDFRQHAQNYSRGGWSRPSSFPRRRCGRFCAALRQWIMSWYPHKATMIPQHVRCRTNTWACEPRTRRVVVLHQWQTSPTPEQWRSLWTN